MSETTKPTLPSEYVVPDVWTFDDPSSSNQPTAGARKEMKLKRGEHDLQLYSLATPNGMKINMLLEELNDLKGIEYDAYKIAFSDLDQFGSDFVAINPNSKIPAMLDTSMDPPLRLFESGSILKYVAEKYDAFIPTDPRDKVEVFNWLFWQVGGAPYIGGGFGHFYKFAPVHIEYAINKFSMETKRQLDVLDKHLEGKTFVVGEQYTIADIAIWPWIMCTIKFYGGKDFLGIDSYKNLMKWYNMIDERPATKRAFRITGFTPDAIAERHSKEDLM